MRRLGGLAVGLARPAVEGVERVAWQMKGQTSVRIITELGFDSPFSASRVRRPFSGCIDIGSSGSSGS